MVATDSRALYGLGAAMLRGQDATRGLSMACENAAKVPGVDRCGAVAIASGQAVHLAGDELNADELKQAEWSYANGRPVGIAIKGGLVVPVKTHGGAGNLAYLPFTSGVVAVALDAKKAGPNERRMLAALIGLADLLLDRRRATLEVERARGFEASDKLKAAILSSLSHELKSPIAALRAGLTALTAPRAGLEVAQRELLTDMDRQATRLDRMVGDLLALSRLEAGMELNREPPSFADMVGGAMRQLRPQLGEHQVAIKIPDDLPAVEVDELQMGRVIGNLLENAI